MSGYTLLVLLVSSLAAAVPVPESGTPPTPVHVFHPLASISQLDRRAIFTPDYWAPSPHFSNMSEYNVTSFAAGATNLAIMRGSPSAVAEGSSANMQEAFSTFTTNWNESVNSLQILYPKGSNAPRNDPQGGTEFYAHPLDLLTARNVSLQYSVYFPSDFDFVKGGKLPGMYGGHKGCSGGNSAVDCFSTRMMWRKDGEGELYLYVPKDKQTPALCSTPPKSICSSDWGLSIGRGAWKFVRGDWTTIRQDIWLNTPGQNDGGFNIWINGQLVMSANEVRYRENAASCSIEALPAGQDAPFAAAAMSTSIVASSAAIPPAWSSEATLLASSTTEYPASSAIPTSMTYDDGSYTWSPPPSPADSSQEVQAAWKKREADSMLRGDPFLLSTPSTTSLPPDATQVSSTLIAEPLPSGTSSTVLFTMSSAEPTPTASPLVNAAEPGSTELAAPVSQVTQDCSIGFIGLFFSTFFGGHTADWSPSSDQYTYFKEFQMWINA